MEQFKSLSTPKHRITVIDSLRGFALLGVILIHMMQHYSIFTSVEHHEALFPILDDAIRWLSQNVIMGKFINIFAFLFGLSFFIQMDSAAKKGVDFRKRFLWRMAILFVIGMIGNCFYSGDILSIYAVFGLIMVCLFKFKNWVLMIIVALLLLGVPRIITNIYNNTVKIEQPESGDGRGVSSESHNSKPSLFNSAKYNLTSGLQSKLKYQFGIYGRGYITLALFIMGLIVGRLRFFETVHSKRRKNIILLVIFTITAIVINFIINLFPEASSIRSIFGASNITPSLLLITAFRDIYSVLFSGAIAIGFVVLYQIKSISRFLDVMTPYGRMGLTNYEMQNVIGATVFSMWGFGSIFGNWGPTEIFVLGLILYAAQVVISRYWLKYHLYGPLEWFWRSATYLKLQPFRRGVTSNDSLPLSNSN